MPIWVYRECANRTNFLRNYFYIFSLDADCHFHCALPSCSAWRSSWGRGQVVETRTAQGQGRLSLQRSPGGTSQMYTLAGVHLSTLGWKLECSGYVESVSLWLSQAVPDLDSRGCPAQDSQVRFQTQPCPWAVASRSWTPNKKRVWEPFCGSASALRTLRGVFSPWVGNTWGNAGSWKAFPSLACTWCRLLRGHQN